jgi:isopentenyl diphosphate isomerase/L-lactate dehydrogenase-like FMN-dependent dehydrogenase
VELPLTLADFEREACARLEEGPLGYYAGGACDERTLEDNVAAWQRLALRPRAMVDVSERELSTTVLGRPRPHPIFVAPTAYHRLATAEGELATIRAAAAADSLYCQSSLATSGVAEVAQAAPEAARWFQVYVFKDRGVTDEMVAAAVEHGYEALVLTVDLPVLGVRYREIRSQFVVTDAVEVPAVPAAGHAEGLKMTAIGELIDPSLTWSDVETFASRSGLPVLVKGVLTPEDARRAAEHGAAGVVVSNHGGRQLDTVLSGADALPAVVDEVGEEIDVLVDGGIRRGTDVLKALALGARAVLVGRPVVWGLAVGGEEGARTVLDLLRAELDVALALAGVPRAAALERSSVQRAPWAGAGDDRPSAARL